MNPQVDDVVSVSGVGTDTRHPGAPTRRVPRDPGLPVGPRPTDTPTPTRASRTADQRPWWARHVPALVVAALIVAVAELAALRPLGLTAWLIANAVALVVVVAGLPLWRRTAGRGRGRGILGGSGRGRSRLGGLGRGLFGGSGRSGAPGRGLFGGRGRTLTPGSGGTSRPGLLGRLAGGRRASPGGGAPSRSGLFRRTPRTAGGGKTQPGTGRFSPGRLSWPRRASRAAGGAPTSGGSPRRGQGLLPFGRGRTAGAGRSGQAAGRKPPGSGAGQPWWRPGRRGTGQTPRGGGPTVKPTLSPTRKPNRAGRPTLADEIRSAGSRPSPHPRRTQPPATQPATTKRPSPPATQPTKPTNNPANTAHRKDTPAMTDPTAPADAAAGIQISDDASLRKWGTDLAKISPVIQEVNSAVVKADAAFERAAAALAKIAQQADTDQPASKRLSAEVAALATQARQIAAERAALTERARGLIAQAETLPATFKNEHERDLDRADFPRNGWQAEKRADLGAMEQDS